MISNGQYIQLLQLVNLNVNKHHLHKEKSIIHNVRYDAKQIFLWSSVILFI